MKRISAVIDASTIYGASRWLRKVHSDPHDRFLFLEFLHQLFLYDHILLDDSCFAENSETEIDDLIATINQISGFELISLRELAGARFGAKRVIQATCRLVKSRLEAKDFSQIDVPWAYHSPTHHDYNDVAACVTELELDSRLIPFVLFAFRGLCYAGFANGQYKHEQQPSVYLAAPRRLVALESLLSTHEMQRLRYPHHAYADLVDSLDLPEAGYYFDQFSSSILPHEVSSFARHIVDDEPDAALRESLRIRSSDSAERLRGEWYDRVLSGIPSSAIGAVQQTISHSQIQGNVNMYIQASAR
jgi:hypothetical protein